MTLCSGRTPSVGLMPKLPTCDHLTQEITFHSILLFLSGGCVLENKLVSHIPSSKAFEYI